MCNIADFTTSDCGQEAGTATGLLGVPGAVSINGSTDLSSCIVGDSSACVYGISLGSDQEGGVYQYTISVDGQGPSGAGSGRMWLQFTDQSGSHYSLSLFSSTRKVHTVSYNSSQPSITTIEWSPQVIVIVPPAPVE